MRIELPPGYPTPEERRARLAVIRAEMIAAGRARLERDAIPFDEVVADDIVDMVRVAIRRLDATDKFMDPAMVQRATDNLLTWVERMVLIREREGGAGVLDQRIASAAVLEIGTLWPYF